MYKRGRDMVSAFFICSCVNTKPMWLTDDLTSSGPAHIFTWCACCTWLVHCLQNLYHVIVLLLLYLFIILWATWISPAFPSLLWEGKLWFTGVSLAVLTDHCCRVRHFPGCSLHKNVLQSPWWIFICLHKYSSAYVLHLCLQLCMMSMPVFITDMV